jgi:hypothetical protein
MPPIGFWSEKTVNAVITATLTSPHGRPLSCSDLGADAAERLGQPDGNAHAQVVLAPATSKAGNTYYSWDLNRLQLPDGLATGLSVNGRRLSMSAPRESKKGNMMVEGTGELVIAGVPHRVSGTLVQTHRPYWVKVLVHVRSGGKRKRTN